MLYLEGNSFLIILGWRVFKDGMVACPYWGVGTTFSGRPTGVSAGVGTDTFWYWGWGYINIWTVWVCTAWVGTWTSMFPSWKGN